MSRKFLMGCSLVLVAAAQPGFAASIYTFSGNITSVIPRSPATNTTYVAQGVYVNAPVTLEVLLDASQLGYSTNVASGVKTYAPAYEYYNGGYRGWAHYAELVSSNIPFGSSIGTTTSNIYGNMSVDPSSWKEPDYNEGYISMGSLVSITKTSSLLDTSAFVENWQVGDTLSMHYSFDAGAGKVGGWGVLTLTSISNPLPPMNPQFVPVPGAGMLFLSSLAGIAGVRRMRRKTL